MTIKLSVLQHNPDGLDDLRVYAAELRAAGSNIQAAEIEKTIAAGAALAAQPATFVFEDAPAAEGDA